VVGLDERRDPGDHKNRPSEDLAHRGDPTDA
jgi:hypothetical protein